jgi:hypothetical protein
MVRLERSHDLNRRPSFDGLWSDPRETYHPQRHPHPGKSAEPSPTASIDVL